LAIPSDILSGRDENDVLPSNGMVLKRGERGPSYRTGLFSSTLAKEPWTPSLAMLPASSSVKDLAITGMEVADNTEVAVRPFIKSRRVFLKKVMDFGFIIS
jgi:hypothetical protein